MLSASARLSPAAGRAGCYRYITRFYRYIVTFSSSATRRCTRSGQVGHQPHAAALSTQRGPHASSAMHGLEAAGPSAPGGAAAQRPRRGAPLHASQQGGSQGAAAPKPARRPQPGPRPSSSAAGGHQVMINFTARRRGHASVVYVLCRLFVVLFQVLCQRLRGVVHGAAPPSTMMLWVSPTHYLSCLTFACLTFAHRVLLAAPQRRLHSGPQLTLPRLPGRR
mgnify:CR=1 FL=1